MENEKNKKEKLKSGKLPDEVAAKYNVIPGIGIGPLQHRGQNIDLRSITLSEADDLVDNHGFKVLVKKPDAPKKV